MQRLHPGYRTLHTALMLLQHTGHCTLVHLAKVVGSVCSPQCSALRAQVVEAQQLHKAGAAVGHRTSSSCSGYCKRTELQQLQPNLLNKTKYLLAHLLCPDAVTAQSDLPISKHLSHCLRLTTRSQLAQLLLQRAK